MIDECMISPKQRQLYTEAESLMNKCGDYIKTCGWGKLTKTHFTSNYVPSGKESSSAIYEMLLLH